MYFDTLYLRKALDSRQNIFEFSYFIMGHDRRLDDSLQVDWSKSDLWLIESVINSFYKYILWQLTLLN